MKKRLIAILLLVTMLFTLFPAEAMALVGDQLIAAAGAIPEENKLNSPSKVISAASAASEDNKPPSPFSDVPEGSWYYDAVQYAYTNGFFGGTGAGAFDPNGTMTRGMFLTVLGRMAGVDQTAYRGQSAFDDVDGDAYYAPYVAWASKHGIADGVGNGKFNPNGLVNREQMAVFLVRYFETFDVDYDTGANITTLPADIDSVSPWAREMVLKLWKTGLLAGDGVNFDPAGNASRAQAATLCMRTDKAVEIWYKEPGVPSDRVSVDPDGEREEPATGDSSGSSGSSGSGGSGSGGVVTTYYEVEFALGNGQGDPDDVLLPAKALYPAQTAISALPLPSKRNAIFLGWYYDGDMTQEV